MSNEELISGSLAKVLSGLDLIKAQNTVIIHLLTKELPETENALIMNQLRLVQLDSNIKTY